MSAVPTILRSTQFIGASAVFRPASASQPIGFVAFASQASALIRETAVKQVRLWRVLAAIERLDRSGHLCPGIPVC